MHKIWTISKISWRAVGLEKYFHFVFDGETSLPTDHSTVYGLSGHIQYTPVFPSFSHLHIVL